MSDGISTHGCTLRLGNNDGPPETFTAIGGLRDGTYDGPEASTHDATTHTSTAREYLGGLVDYGEIEFEVLWSHSTQQLAMEGLVGATRNFQLDLPSEITTNERASFTAVIVAVGGLNLDNDGAFMSTLRLKIDGAVSWGESS